MHDKKTINEVKKKSLQHILQTKGQSLIYQELFQINNKIPTTQ